MTSPLSRVPDIDPNRCTGCGRCVAACEPRVLSLETVRWDKFAALHDPQRCTGCSLCAVVCPFRAITMRAATDAQGVCTAPGASADSAGGGAIGAGMSTFDTAPSAAIRPIQPPATHSS